MPSHCFFLAVRIFRLSFFPRRLRRIPKMISHLCSITDTTAVKTCVSYSIFFNRFSFCRPVVLTVFGMSIGERGGEGRGGTTLPHRPFSCERSNMSKTVLRDCVRVFILVFRVATPHRHTAARPRPAPSPTPVCLRTSTPGSCPRGSPPRPRPAFRR